LVNNPTGDFFNEWSPDGTAFVYGSTIDDSTTSFYKNSRLFIYDMKTKASREIAQDIDEHRNMVSWHKSGLYIAAQEKTRQKIFTVDLKTG
jgi:Tol biopolymer transport system component